MKLVGRWSGTIDIEPLAEYVTNKGTTKFTDKKKWPATAKQGDYKSSLKMKNAHLTIEGFCKKQ